MQINQPRGKIDDYINHKLCFSLILYKIWNGQEEQTPVILLLLWFFSQCFIFYGDEEGSVVGRKGAVTVHLLQLLITLLDCAPGAHLFL